MSLYPMSSPTALSTHYVLLQFFLKLLSLGLASSVTTALSPKPLWPSQKCLAGFASPVFHSASESPAGSYHGLSYSLLEASPALTFYHSCAYSLFLYHFFNFAGVCATHRMMLPAATWVIYLSTHIFLMYTVKLMFCSWKEAWIDVYQSLASFFPLCNSPMALDRGWNLA